MLILLQVQNPVLRPGTGTLTSHSFEILFICLGMFLLGWFLHHLIHCTRHKSRISELEGNLKSARTRIGDLESDLESCNSAMITVKGENASLSSKLSHAEKELASLSLQAADGAEVAVQDSTTAIADSPEASPAMEEAMVSSLAADIAGAGIKAFDAEKAKAVFGKRIAEDDFKIIEGIGPKTESLLKTSSIHTWNQLSSTSVPQIQNILDEAGDRFRLLNPSTWPKQAGMAADGEWLKLRAYQDYLVNGVEPVGEDQPPFEESGDVVFHMGKRVKQDDLTVVEGIGPKIQQLLHENAIKTWLQLSKTSVDALQAILTSAGEKYRIHEPRTWPKQAEMAAAGKWDELQQYQEYLDGGKDPN